MTKISPVDVSSSPIPVSLLRTLLSESDIQFLLENLTNYVEETFPHLKALILIYHPESHCLMPGSRYSLPVGDAKLARAIPVRADGTTSSRAAHFKTPILTPDVHQEEAWRPLLTGECSMDLRSVLSLPILSPKQDLLGTFTFFLPKTLNEFPDEMSFFQTLSSIAAVTLERYSSERKTQLLLDELKSSQERLNLALLSQKMGVWDWYIPTDRLIWDSTVFEILGSTRHEFQGRLIDWQKTLHPGEAESKMQTLKRILESQTTFEETFQILKDGKARHISCVGYVVRDEKDQPLRMTGLHWDITEKVIAHNKVEQEKAKAVANSKMASLGEMASCVAHEINNPLTIILNRANQIKSRISTDEFDKNWVIGELEKVEGTVERIAKIIRGLRAFSRNADTDPMISCEFNSILEETLELCRERFKRFKISFSIRGLQNVFSLNCRPSQISQVLLNLFNNSFDAIVNAPTPWIEMDIELLNGKVRLRITDSGPGIPSHISERMMDPFFSTKEVGRGTGLGLSISKGIIEDHGGRIWYDSEKASTSFVIELPIESCHQISTPDPLQDSELDSLLQTATSTLSQ